MVILHSHSPSYPCPYLQFHTHSLLIPPSPIGLKFTGQIPQFGYCDEVNMNQLVSLRSVIKDQLLEKGIKFSYMPIIIKAVSMALKEYPILNATVNPECTAITYKADQNIGVAMDTPEGLVVPIVKQVQVCGNHSLSSS